MSKVILCFSLFFVLSCTSQHDKVYVYKDQAYTSTNISEFEIGHFKFFGSENILSLEGNPSTMEEKQRFSELVSLCEKHEMNCKSLSLNSFTFKETLEAAKKFNSFSGEKFLLLAPSKRHLAFFLGFSHFIENASEDIEALREIINGLAVSEGEALLNEILELYRSNSNSQKSHQTESLKSLEKL